MTTRQQRVSIPVDYDGEWSCFSVEWPDSPLWRAILRGLLSLPSGGRFWREDGLSIKDAQSIGYEIVKRNIPLVSCAGEEIIDDELQPELQFIAIGSEEDEIMGWLCGVNPEAFKIENGVLSVRSFCGSWVEIGALTDPKDENPNPIPIENPTVPYSKCGKASSLLDVAAAVIGAAVEHKEDDTEFYTAVYNQYTANGVKPGKADIYLLQLDIVAVTQVISDDSITSDILLQKMKCKAEVGMDGTTAEGTQAEVDWIYSSVRSACYEFMIDTVSAELLWTAWQQVIQTMGDNDRKHLLSRGSQNFDADCTCPGDGIIEASKIIFTGGYSIASGVAAFEKCEVKDGGRRLFIQIAAAAGSFRSAVDVHLNLAGQELGDYMKVRIYPAKNATEPDGHMPAREWYTDCEPTTTDKWFQLDTYGATNVDTVRTNETDYVEFQTGNDGTETILYLKAPDMRMTPQSVGFECTATPWRETFYVEIVGVNEIDYTPIGPV